MTLVTAPGPRRGAVRLLQRVLVAVAGTAITVVGLVLVPLPGPGWAIVAVGTALLGTEFRWAARLSERLRGVLSAVVARSAGRPGAQLLLVLAAVAGVVLPLLVL